MKKHIIAKKATLILALMISINAFAQKVKLTMGRDTVWVLPSQIGHAIDSIKSERLRTYENERKRLQDSLEEEERLAIRRAPALYYLSASEDGTRYMEKEIRPDSSLVASMPHDSIVTFSALSYAVLSRIAKGRAPDSTAMEEFRESIIEEMAAKKAVLAKDRFEMRECDSCVESIVEEISQNKRYWKRLTSEKTEGIAVCVWRTRTWMRIEIEHTRGWIRIRRTIEEEIE